ncbi:hypothetical protein ElyMa_005223800 [Elysia marginata]|uniref:Hexosyltransferase n=1 Tax=Elysia marginata TaxID=1093978 RepID=A0AAV4JYV6_9GAST|nr:hypothetical protein ElyMa_005223800 [Elysia marginata]
MALCIHILFLGYPWYIFNEMHETLIKSANISFKNLTLTKLSFEGDYLIKKTVNKKKEVLFNLAVADKKAVNKKKKYPYVLSPKDKRALGRNGKKKSMKVQECRNVRNLNERRYSVLHGSHPESGANLSKLPRVQEINSSFDIRVLAEILDKRLQIINASDEAIKYCAKSWHATCYNQYTMANSCDKARGCLRTQLSQDTPTKIRQLVDRPNLKLRPNQIKPLQEMAELVDNTYDIIFLSAASSNHYLELQGLLQSLHTNVFLLFKNFTFLVYDLGFTSKQRETLQKFCRCKLLTFRFFAFENFATDLKKFAWKPYLVRAHLHQARVLVWMDTSIRFYHNPAGLQRLFTQDIGKFGVMVGYSVPDSCFTTCRSTYHWFGDEPCAYLGLPIFQASVLIFHNDPVVHRLVVEPWTACAFNENCIAPSEEKCTGSSCASAMKTYHDYKLNNSAIAYGLCHHYDQAVITLILHKLYLQYSPLLRIKKNETLIICRGDYHDYFGSLG